MLVSTRALLPSRYFSSLLPNILAGAVVALGVATMITTIWIVVHACSPVLFWDQWELVRTLMKSHGHISIGDLWAQNNEHRAVTGRILGFADFYLFGGRNVSLFTEIIALQLCHLVLLLFVTRRFGSLPRSVYLTVAGFLTYCLFSPIQMENFIWAFQVVFVLTSLAATASCAAALYHAQASTSANGKGDGRWLLVAVACAFLAEITEAHGLITWMVLLFLAFALRFSRRDKLIVFLSASIAIALYMIGYQSPGSSHPLAHALKQPGAIVHFTVVYLARSWDAHLPTGSAWPSVSESIASLAIIAALLWSAWCLRRPLACTPVQIALLGNVLFSLGTAVMTAIGRSEYGGLQGAISIRYQTPALVFWGSFAALIAFSLDWRPQIRLPVAQGLLLIVMVAGGGRWHEMGYFAEARQYGPEMAWNAIAQGRFDDPALANISANPKMLKPLALYLRGHGWGPAGEITSFAKLQPVSRPLRIQGYQVQTQACIAHWDEARRSGLTSVSVGGWGLSLSAGQAPRRVAFASGTGKIVGDAEIKSVRQDVAARYPGARDVKTGWETNLGVPGEDIYHAFLLFEDTRTACPVPGELRIRHYPVF